MTKKQKEEEMSRFKLPLVFVIMSAICMPAMAGEKFVKPVPTGASAFHFVFDLNFLPSEPGGAPNPEFLGYIAFIEGVDSPLFDSSDPDKLEGIDTAYFTIRVTKPLPFPPLGFPEGLPVPDPDLRTLVYAPGGQFTVFYNSSPVSRDWNEPWTFSQGVPIAVFDESALLGTEALGNYPGIYFNVFSSKLIDSKPIKFKGQRIDFRKLVPKGVTVTNFGNARPADRFGASGSGTAIAIGGRPKHKSCHR